MNFKPLGDRILVLRAEEESKTQSGIYIPDSAKEKPQEAIVKAISSDVEDEGNISLEDRVVFAKYSGTELMVDGVEYLVLETGDILGIKG